MIWFMWRTSMGNRKVWFTVAAAVGLTSGIATVQAQLPAYYTGNVIWLEVWKNGNVAFTLATSGVPCNGQFVINGGLEGARNAYAALLGAKLADKPLRVYVGSCVTPPGTSGSYADVNYLYID
jgi:hypothetical protein